MPDNFLKQKQNMIRSILFAAGILLLAASCSNESTTAGGFKYIHHVKNKGPKAQAGEYVYFHVVMTNGDSVLVDTRTQPDVPTVLIPQPEELEGQPPSPVLEALLLMAAGDSLTIFYPLDSLPTRPAGFENTKNVVYHLKLLEIKTTKQYEDEFAAKQAEAEAVLQTVREKAQALLEQYKANQLADRIQTTATGLKYVLVEEGSGAVPMAGQTLNAHYYGILMDGTEFDNSYGRGQVFTFQPGVGQVIAGWDEAFTTLKIGTKAMLFIPSELGYGETGAPPVIPPNSELAFFVELISVN
jgi:FKBP-type peptidyl-prolyl cis-trans isomerase FkpA